MRRGISEHKMGISDVTNLLIPLTAPRSSEDVHFNASRSLVATRPMSFQANSGPEYAGFIRTILA